MRNSPAPAFAPSDTARCSWKQVSQPGLAAFSTHLIASGRKWGKVRFPEEFRREAIRLAQLGDRPQRKLA